MPTFTIIINDAQRRRLIDLLRAADLPEDDPDTSVDRTFLANLENLDPERISGLCH